MAELEIDKEDVHARRKWRRNVMKRKSNPIGKRDYKPIIYIYIIKSSMFTISVIGYGYYISKIDS